MKILFYDAKIYDKRSFDGVLPQFPDISIEYIEEDLNVRTANIAEGYKKLSKADKLRFFNISQGSLEECKYYILLSKDLGYISNESYIELCSLAKETSKLLLLYIQGVQNNDYKNL